MTIERNDAPDSAFFEGQLRNINGRIFDVRTPALRARELIPVNNQPSWSDLFSYRVMNGVGVAKVVAAYADDIPRSDLKGSAYTVTAKTLAASFGYSFIEINQAREAGLDLEQRKANVARRAIAELEEAIAVNGDTANGLLGLLNQPNVPVYAVPNGAGGSPLWADKTAEEIVADLNAVTGMIVSGTNGVEQPDTLVMPSSAYAQLSTMTIGAGDRTVLDFFLENSPWIENIEQWQRCAGAGVGGTDRLVAYRRDPDALELRIPQEVQAQPVQVRNFTYVVNLASRIAGVIVHLPLSMAYADGF